MTKRAAQLERDIAVALREPRVANKAKLVALVRFHVDTTAMWRAEAAGQKASGNAEADDEARRALEIAKAHEVLAKKIATAAVSTPLKIGALSRLEMTPDELHMSEDDVWGVDD